MSECSSTCQGLGTCQSNYLVNLVTFANSNPAKAQKPGATMAVSRRDWNLQGKCGYASRFCGYLLLQWGARGLDS